MTNKIELPKLARARIKMLRDYAFDLLKETESLEDSTMLLAVAVGGLDISAARAIVRSAIGLYLPEVARD